MSKKRAATKAKAKTKPKNEKSKSKADSPLLIGADFPAELIEPLVTRLNPPILAEFSLESFVRAVLGSFSLSLVEKQRIFDSIPTLSIFQHDALMEVFTDETEEFARWLATEAPIVLDLAAHAWIEANLLAGYHAVGYATREAEQDALNALLARKYETRKQRAWIEEVPLNQWKPAARVIFGCLRPPESGDFEADDASIPRVI